MFWKTAATSNQGGGPHRLALQPGAVERAEPGPFAWQDGRRLWILDGRMSEWVLAELVFEPHTCRYVEVRRSIYRWPREAAGALLSRTFAAEQGQVEIAARGLAEWASRVQSS